MRIMPNVLLMILLLAIAAFAQEANEEFFAAARRGDIPAIKAFLDKGVDVNSKTRYGATALSYACDKGHVEVVKLLIERGADVNMKDTFYGEVPMGWALSHGYAQIVKLLLDKGATGIERALMAGADSGNTELIKVVLEKGGLKQDALNSALRRASAGTNKEIVEQLKKAGAVVNEVSVEPEVLKTYIGAYKNEQVGVITFNVKEGKLVGDAMGQGGFRTSAISKTKFAIIEVDATVTFNVEGDKVTGFTLSQGGGNF